MRNKVGVVDDVWRTRDDVLFLEHYSPWWVASIKLRSPKVKASWDGWKGLRRWTWTVCALSLPSCGW